MNALTMVQMPLAMHQAMDTMMNFLYQVFLFQVAAHENATTTLTMCLRFLLRSNFDSKNENMNPLRNGHVSNGKIKANGDENVSIPQWVHIFILTY